MPSILTNRMERKIGEVSERLSQIDGLEWITNLVMTDIENVNFTCYIGKWCIKYSE